MVKQEGEGNRPHSSEEEEEEEEVEEEVFHGSALAPSSLGSSSPGFSSSVFSRPENITRFYIWIFRKTQNKYRCVKQRGNSRKPDT